MRKTAQSILTDLAGEIAEHMDAGAVALLIVESGKLQAVDPTTGTCFGIVADPRLLGRIRTHLRLVLEGMERDSAELDALAAIAAAPPKDKQN